MMLRILTPLLLVFCLMACEKKETPIQAHEAGEVTLQQVELGSSYSHQIFFSLAQNEMLGKNEKDAWDLGFEAQQDAWHIVLNSARGGALAHTNSSDINASFDVKSLDWKYDVPSGNEDSTALGDYRNSDLVYVLDRGYTAEGEHTGYLKFKVAYLGDSYKLEAAEVTSTSVQSFSIAKNDALNYVCFSWDSKGPIPFEPDREIWDLNFTQYTHLFHDPLTPYLVTGVRTNPNQVQVAELGNLSFEEVTLEQVNQLEFKSELDIIGYDWKTFDFDASSYAVHAEDAWVIRSVDGRYFKFHFIDFYNDKGEKGAPKFEFQEL